VEPLYDQLDRFQRGSISRREFLKRAVALGVGTPAILTFLEGCAPPLTPVAPAASPTAAVGASRMLEKPGEGADVSQPLIFRGWSYSVDTVQDNTDKFNAAYAENVDYKTITGDYISIIENMHINNQTLDMVYANPATAARWYVPQWIHDYEGFWDVDRVKEELYDGVRDSVTLDGKLIGLPYFVSIRGNLVANDIILEKVGITPADYPKTYEELYDQCRRIKQEGAADTPLLHHWFAAGVWFGVSWGYLFECLNRGAVLFDDNNEPVFDEQTLAILNEWKQLFDEGLVPEGVFTMGETDFIDAFAKGTYAYSPQQTYDVKVFNDPARSAIAGKCRLVPVQGQPWGLIDEGLYLVPNRNQDDNRLARDYRLAGFFGYRDDKGDLFVAKRWAIENALNSGYKAVLEDPEVIAAYQEWAPDENHIETMNGVLAAAPFPKVWHTFWWEEFNSTLSTEIPAVILGQKDAAEVHASLKTLAQDLITRYAS
jgi:multiple sugar transport system substrate-binding protein